VVTIRQTTFRNLPISNGSRSIDTSRIAPIVTTPRPHCVRHLDLADSKVSVLNLNDDCFFVSEQFDPAANERFRIADGTSLPNVHGVMAIAVGFNATRIPVVVDSGAGASTLPAALLNARLRFALLERTDASPPRQFLQGT